MEGFETIEAGKLSENFIRLIGQEWMLVTAGESGRFNTMTASWGGIGYLWNKPVAFVFIRPATLYVRVYGSTGRIYTLFSGRKQ